MDQQKWLLVKANFDGTEDLADGYYRLRTYQKKKMPLRSRN